MYRSAFYQPRLLEKQWSQEKKRINLRRVKRAKATVKMPNQSYVLNKAKKERLQEERFTEIERENRILLEKMNKIMNRQRPKLPKLAPKNFVKKVYKKGVLIDDRYFIVEFKRDSSLLYIYAKDAYGPDSYALELTYQEARGLTGWPIDYDQLLTMLCLESGELILSER